MLVRSSLPSSNPVILLDAVFIVIGPEPETEKSRKSSKWYRSDTVFLKFLKSCWKFLKFRKYVPHYFLKFPNFHQKKYFFVFHKNDANTVQPT